MNQLLVDADGGVAPSDELAEAEAVVEEKVEDTAAVGEKAAAAAAAAGQRQKSRGRGKPDAVAISDGAMMMRKAAAMRSASPQHTHTTIGGGKSRSFGPLRDVTCNRDVVELSPPQCSPAGSVASTTAVTPTQGQHPHGRGHALTPRGEAYSGQRARHMRV